MSGVNYPYRYLYEHVPASQTDQVLGGTGAAGDYLDRLICTVSTAATSRVQITDGAFVHTILPNIVGGGIGVYVIPVQAASKTTGWKVTTAAGVEVIGVGIFSA
jgi:hypothetical protein